jgi:hypothetical protein
MPPRVARARKGRLTMLHRLAATMGSNAFAMRTQFSEELFTRFRRSDPSHVDESLAHVQTIETAPSNVDARGEDLYARTRIGGGHGACTRPGRMTANGPMG